MIKKVQSYDEALDAIEAIDQEISAMLDSDNRHAELLLIMQKRLVYVSEIGRLKDNSEPSAAVKARIKAIFESADSVQEKVRLKRDKIKSRLDKNKKLNTKNKKLKY